MILSYTSTRIAVFSIALASLGMRATMAGDYEKVVIDDEAPVAASPWEINNLFKHTTLYEGDGFIRKVKFFGRYHGQYEELSGQNNGDTFGGRYWKHRRWRVGLRVDFPNNIRYSGNFNLDRSIAFNGGSSGRFVQSAEDITIRWEPSDDFYLMVGKEKPTITREYTTSSKRILTFERSAIVNNVLSDKAWGVEVGFTLGSLFHRLALYSNLYDNDWKFPVLDQAGLLGTYRTSYEISDETEAFFDYQYNDVKKAMAATGRAAWVTSRYEHVFVVGTLTDSGRLDLVTDFIYGANRLAENDDTFGFVLMPSYDLTDKLQFVTRYAYMADGKVSHPQSDVLFTKLDNASVDALHTFYVGFNYRINSDKLKLMAGYEYATAKIQGSGDDYKASSFLVGVRTYW